MALPGGNPYASYLTVKVQWRILAGTVDDVNYEIRVYLSQQVTPSVYNYIASVATSATYYVAFDSWVQQASTGTFHYFAFQVKIHKKSDGSVIDTKTTSQLIVEGRTCP